MSGRFGVLLTVAALIVTSPAPATAEDAAAPKTTLDLVEVSPSVVMARHSQGSNVTCIALDDGLVFVDAGMNTEAATAFRRSMEARFERPTQALVLTHNHIDHVFAMGAFADVRVLLAAQGRPQMERLIAAEWTDERIAAFDRIFDGFAEAAPAARVFEPTDWIDARTTLGRPGRQLVITTTGGHSVDSSNVWFEAEKVLVAGDLVQAARRPYFGDPTTDMAAWVDTLASWQGMGVARVCPGHGPVIAGDDLAPIRAYFEQLLATLAELKAEGLTVEQAVADARLPAGYWPPEGDWPLPAWWPSCIARAWQQADG